MESIMLFLQQCLTAGIGKEVDGRIQPLPNQASNKRGRREGELRTFARK